MQNAVAALPFDFFLSHRGEVFRVQPVSLPAQRYADQFLPRNSSFWFEGSLDIHASDFVDVFRGIQESGLTISGGVS